MLGNIQFNQVKDKLGFELTEEDKILWDEFNSQIANLKDVDKECFHIFDIPRCITVKGEKAKQALLKIFDSSKLVNAMGQIAVYEI